MSAPYDVMFGEDSEDGANQRLEDVLARLGQQPASAFSDGLAPFATAENVADCCRNLNHALAVAGLPSGLVLPTTTAAQAADVANCLHAALMGRQADMAFREATHDAQRRAAADVASAASAVARLSARLDARERELGAATNAARAAETAHKRAVAKATSEREEATKAAVAAQHKVAAQAAEMRRRERDAERVTERLAALLAEKTKAAKGAMDVLGALQLGTPAGGLGPLRPGSVKGGAGTSQSTKEDDYLRLVAGAYEAKQRELAAENGDLKAALRALQGDMRDLLNHGGGEGTPAGGASPWGPGPEATPCRGQDLFGLPYAMARDAIEGSLADKVSALRNRLAHLAAARTPAAPAATAREAALSEELGRARAVLRDQDALLAHALGGKGARGDDAPFGDENDGEVGDNGGEGNAGGGKTGPPGGGGGSSLWGSTRKHDASIFASPSDAAGAPGAICDAMVTPVA